jgi:GNAT superfamily N-acetyltransferase
MSERTYPGEPVGPFPSPPREFEDREDRSVEIRGDPPGAAVPPALTEMYEAFDAADRAQGIPPAGGEQLDRWLGDLYETGYNVVAWEGEQAVGHATLVPEETDPGLDGDDAGAVVDQPYELAIFVLQSHQEAGIGKQLLRTLLGFGADNGIERVWLTVEQWNRPAVNLYEDIGFETVSARSFEREMTIRLA